MIKTVQITDLFGSRHFPKVLNKATLQDWADKSQALAWKKDMEKWTNMHQLRNWDDS